MIETTHDRIILLSGIASNRALLTDYMTSFSIECRHGYTASCPHSRIRVSRSRTLSQWNVGHIVAS